MEQYSSCEEVTPICLTQLFQCTNCLKIINSGPIFQCSVGHLFCIHCLHEIDECNVCGVELVNIRCRGMEAMREVVEVPLQFGSYMGVIPDLSLLGEEINKIKATPELVNLIKEHMACPVCLCYMASKIYQCHEGHFLCELCKKRLVNPLCPSCKEEFDVVRVIRCSGLENINKIDVSECPFGGCQKIIPLFQRSEHLVSCRFRKFQCCIKGVNDCGLYYNSFELESHLIHAHGVCYPTEVLNEVELVVNNVAIFPNRMVLTGFGRLFLLSTVRYINRSDNIPVYLVYLSIFGSKTETEDFVCSLKITKEGGVLLWTGKCYETEECSHEDFENLSGLVFNERMASDFDRNASSPDDGHMLKLICSLKRAEPEA